MAFVAKVRRLQKLRATILGTNKKTAAVLAKPTDLDQWKDDFVGFAAKLDIVAKDGKRTKLRPNAIQSAFEVTRSGRDVILKPRQVGFTTWELARDAWYFLTRRGANVVVVCQSDSENDAIKAVCAKLKIMFESLASAGISIPDLDSSTTTWLLPSRDASLRVISSGASEAAAQKKGRGGSIHRLHVTELAFFEHAATTLNALLECVPVNDDTEVVFESTANGAAGFFFDHYQDAKNGKNSFRSTFFRWLDQAEYAIPLESGETIAPQTERERAVMRAGGTLEQLKWYRRKVADKKDQDLVDQEYPLDEDTCWLVSGRLFFDKDRVRELYSLCSAPFEVRDVGRGKLRIFRPAQSGRRYVLPVDPSEGVGGDPGAVPILDRGTGAHVASLHGQFEPWELAKYVAELGRGFFIGSDGKRATEIKRTFRDVNDEALVVVERNNHGHAVLQGLIREQRYGHIYVGPDKRPGWVTNEVTRAAALAALQAAVADKHWSSPERETIEEFLKFIVLHNGRAEAAKGANDDLVLGHAIGWDICCRPVIDRYVPEHHRAQ